MNTSARGKKCMCLHLTKISGSSPIYCGPGNTWVKSLTLLSPSNMNAHWTGLALLRAYKYARHTLKHQPKDSSGQDKYPMARPSLPQVDLDIIVLLGLWTWWLSWPSSASILTWKVYLFFFSLSHNPPPSPDLLSAHSANSLYQE